MNIKDLENYEVEESSEESKPLNLADLGDYEIEEEPKKESSELELDAPGALETKLLTDKTEEIVPIVRKSVKSMGKEGLAKVPFGRLEADDVSRLYNKRDTYKELRDSPGKLGDKFAEAAKSIEQVGYDATKNVGQALDAQGKSIKTDELLSELETRASDISYEPDEARLKEAETSSKALADSEKKIKKAETFYDKKENDAKKKLEELEDRISEYKQKRFEKQELDRMRDLEVKSINERLDILKDEKMEYDDPTASKQINKEMEMLRREKRKLSENLKDRTYDLKKSSEGDVKVIRDLEAEKKNIQRELKNSILPERKKELSRLENLKKSAEKTASEKSIQKKALTEEAEKYLDRLKKQLSNKKTLSGEDLAKEMKRLNKQFGKPGADEIRQAFRSMLQDMSSYVGESGKKATQAITDYQNMLKDLPLEQVEEVTDLGKGTKVRQKDNFNRALAGAFTTEEGAELTKKQDIIDMLKRAGREDLVEEAELNKILQLTREGKASLTDVLSSVKSGGVAAAPTGRILETGATKLQELGTLAAGKLSDLAKSPVGKVAGKLGKGALKSLPFVAAGLDYAEAGDLGIESELGKLAYTGVESINPLPISTGQIVKSMNEQAPIRSAATRRAKASNFGLQDEKNKPITIKQLENKESAQQLIYDLSEGENYEYARRLDNIVNQSKTKNEYERKMGMLSSDPAFREILKRRKKANEDVENDDGNEN